MSEKENGRPRDNEDGPTNVLATTTNNAKIPQEYDRFPGLTVEQSQVIHHWLAQSYGVPADRLAFVAIVELAEGKYRRRPYLTLAGAQSAVERAESRGVKAKVGLFELMPVQEAS